MNVISSVHALHGARRSHDNETLAGQIVVAPKIDASGDEH
jgi:hypothetical protein